MLSESLQVALSVACNPTMTPKKKKRNQDPNPLCYKRSGEKAEWGRHQDSLRSSSFCSRQPRQLPMMKRKHPNLKHYVPLRLLLSQRLP